jgi:hypothetical protein
MVMTFLMYARFQEMSEMVITATNSSAVVISTTDLATMHRATEKVEMKLETAGR